MTSAFLSSIMSKLGYHEIGVNKFSISLDDPYYDNLEITFTTNTFSLSINLTYKGNLRVKSYVGEVDYEDAELIRVISSLKNINYSEKHFKLVNPVK